MKSSILGQADKYRPSNFSNIHKMSVSDSLRNLKPMKIDAFEYKQNIGDDNLKKVV